MDAACIVQWSIILKRILGKHGGKMWNGCTWLSTGTIGGLL